MAVGLDPVEIFRCTGVAAAITTPNAARNDPEDALERKVNENSLTVTANTQS